MTTSASSGPSRGAPSAGGPLRGIRVIDASRVLAGPFCGSILAELGADVTRLEHPTALDEVRGWYPRVAGASAAFVAVNHTKRSAVVDIAQAQGAEVFRRWLARSDVLIENFRAGTLERFGFGADTLRAINPRLIHCAIRAYPAGTAAENEPGYEASLQAYTGVMSVTGERDGDPVRCGVSVIDLGTGLSAVIAILAALRERDRTGEGQYVEPALMRTATNFLNYQIAGWTAAGVEPQRFGSGHEALVPYRNFRCADGLQFIAAGNDRLWERLCDVLGLREPAASLPYPRLADRIAARAEVEAMVQAAVAGVTRAALWERLRAAGIPSAPVNTVAQYTEDATLLDAGVLTSLSVPGEGDVRMAGALFAAGGYWVPRAPPPAFGAHTDEVLAELGLSPAERDALRRAGTIR